MEFQGYLGDSIQFRQSETDYVPKPDRLGMEETMLPHFLSHLKHKAGRLYDAKRGEANRMDYSRGNRCGRKPTKPRQLFKLANRMSDLENED